LEQKNQVRERLPESCRQHFDDITEGRVLGASRHIRMIGDMMLAIAQGASAHKLEDCAALAEYFKASRGQASYAFVLAMGLLTQGFASQGGVNARPTIETAVEGYFKQAEENMRKVVKYSCALAKTMNTLLVFDYSSTVERFVLALREPRTVFVPESRAINGGRPFIEKFAQAGHRVRFIPDAAMLTVLPQVDAAFMGAETYYPDGTVFNTVGSDILGELCRLCRVPYYALTPLIKIDMRAANGILKGRVEADLGGRLAADWPPALRGAVDFRCVELVGVAPRLSTALVTEAGILPSSAVYAVAKKFNDTIMERGV
jgi:ribose 1,5-bisphosphate isomerase